MEADTKGLELRRSRPLFAEILARQGYGLESEIGAGGQAIVYSCYRERDGEQYAVKIALAEDEVTVPAELLALQAVWNPNIINVYMTFISEGFRFIVLEFCPGGSLHDMIKEGPIPMGRLWPLGRQIVYALRACHTEGVAHLDIKPQNILIDKHGRAKLCDFGLAKRTDSGQLSNQFKGSVAFMAPEILRKHDYDPFKADVWSLGVTFYVCATGHLPWPTTAKEFFAGVARGLDHVDQSLPVDFAIVLKMMIIPDPQARARLIEVVPFFENKCEGQPKFARISSLRGSVGFSHRMSGLMSSSGSDFLRLKYLSGDPVQNEADHLAEEPDATPPSPLRSSAHILRPVIFRGPRKEISRHGSGSNVAMELKL
jgi:serine/threonine protein kinase